MVALATMADKRAERIAELIKPLRVKPGSKVNLAKDFDPGYKAGYVKKKDARRIMDTGIAMLCDYQARLAAQDSYGVLMCLQALDAGGKDGTIRHVMSGVNPQGVHVTSFKKPSAEELDHDYLWRYARRLPARGDIGIFNRSHYEEVLVVRVHPENLDRQKLPDYAKDDGVWQPPLPRDQRLGALPDRKRVPRREDVPEPVEGRAADPVLQAARPAGEELEVLGRRRPGAPALGRLPGGVLGDAVRYQHRLGPLVRDTGGPQVVRPDLRGRGADAHPDRHRPAATRK